MNKRGIGARAGLTATWALAVVAGCGQSEADGSNEGGRAGEEAEGGEGGEDPQGVEGGATGAAGTDSGNGAAGGRSSAANPDAGAGAGKADSAVMQDGGKADAGPTLPSYACTQVLGPNVTGEWFGAGFERVVDGTRWQVKAPHRSFVEDWANPNHAVWRESGCDGTFFNCETTSKCAGGKAPERIIFVTQTGDFKGTTQQKWQELIASAVATIRAKYPAVKNVELMTFIRGPGNRDCGNETTVSDRSDKAHVTLAAASNGFITVAPRFEASACNWFAGAPHLSDAGSKAAAQLIAKHYAAFEKQ